MSDPRYVRTGETQQRYLGDGVYAAFDGHQIWLRADRYGMIHVIAIEAPVFVALAEYVKDLEVGNVN